MSDNQQVVFITGVLWGGGAERVVYDLAHNLNKDHFEVHIICLFEQPDITVSFDPRISIHHLEPMVRGLASSKEENTQSQIPLTTRKRLYFFAKRLYQRVVPASIRQNLKVEERLYELKSLFLASPPTPVSMENPELSQLLQSIRNIMISVEALQQVLTMLRKDAILIPVMEEATVRVWLSQLFERRRPYIASLHSVESYNLGLMYPDPTIRSVEDWLFVNACRAAHVVTVPTRGCRYDLQLHYGMSPDPIKVIPNPIDMEEVLRRAELPLRFEDDARKTLFVYVGRLAPDKNPELLIDAAYLLKQKYTDFRIYCIGKGGLHSELLTQIQKQDLQDNIVLLGEVPNPFPYMRKSRALVLTSRVESFALVLVEAMLCGTVPIAVDCPYGPREVLEDGKYGLLVPQDNPQALADAMWQIANNDDLHSQFQGLGPGRARHYNISRIVDEWENLLSEIQRGQDQKNDEYL